VLDFVASCIISLSWFFIGVGFMVHYCMQKEEDEKEKE